MTERTRAKAAVLDACYLPEGRLNIGDVMRLAAGLAARRGQLWIPEVVVLEFAVHAGKTLGLPVGFTNVTGTSSRICG